MESRFGIPGPQFDDYLMFERRKSWWLLRNSFHVQRAFTYKVFAFGIKAFQRVGRFIKPTTRIIQIFGAQAVKAVVTVSVEELPFLWEGKGFRLKEDLEDGYVILTVNGRILGLGLSIQGWVRPQIRKGHLGFHRFSTIP
ncbi:MAG: hypothetical protein JXL84_02040 [Deltaproteobacteria bacterium]|nr:hypothetical protein [Deltaproteobacteria bacterium]